MFFVHPVPLDTQLIQKVIFGKYFFYFLYNIHMNLYIIVEGRRTEKKVYPAWISYLIPKLSPINWAYQVNNNDYYFLL